MCFHHVIYGVIIGEIWRFEVRLISYIESKLRIKSNITMMSGKKTVKEINIMFDCISLNYVVK